MDSSSGLLQQQSSCNVRLLLVSSGLLISFASVACLHHPVTITVICKCTPICIHAPSSARQHIYIPCPAPPFVQVPSMKTRLMDAASVSRFCSWVSSSLRAALLLAVVLTAQWKAALTSQLPYSTRLGGSALDLEGIR
jgi:hypothetical protein